MISHPDLQLLYEYWLSKRHGRVMPSRADLDPTELPGSLWPRLVLLDVVQGEGGVRFRGRLISADNADVFGHDSTGKYLDEVLDPRDGYRDTLLKILTDITVEKRPIFVENQFALGKRDVPMLHKRLSLPLSSDGVTVDMILSGLIFETPERDRHAAWDYARAFKEIRRYYPPT